MKKVLVAEDDLIFRLFTKNVLTKQGKDRFEVIVVEDGLEAIKVLQQGRIDVLVTDLKMPKIEGLVLLTYVNKNHPDIPCIIMTSLRRPVLKEKLEDDVLFYLEKPFSPGQLEKAVQTALVQRQRQAKGLPGISILSFLQLIEMEEKNCICEVEWPNHHEKGYFYFVDGILYKTKYSTLRGKAAAEAILKRGRAVVHLRKPEKGTLKREMKTQVQDLVLEAMRKEHSKSSSECSSSFSLFKSGE